ncbi:hypothetical protein Ciccas_006148 [Cichlidogyrus casuarinus]|uniref:Uncharacterized protein n=1 Tax=Cichlidogyrus casuarinus TaxID=1844966 RepID=A0ABD2Q6Q6_9PLAT
MILIDPAICPSLPTLEWLALLQHSKSDEDALTEGKNFLNTVKSHLESVLSCVRALDSAKVVVYSFVVNETVSWAVDHGLSFRLDSQILKLLMPEYMIKSDASCLAVMQLALLQCHQFELNSLVQLLFDHFSADLLQFRRLVSPYFERFLVKCLCPQSKLKCDHKCTAGMAIAINRKLLSFAESGSKRRCHLADDKPQLTFKHVTVAFVESEQMFSLVEGITNDALSEELRVPLLRAALHFCKHARWHDFGRPEELVKWCLALKPALFSTNKKVVRLTGLVYEEMIKTLPKENLLIWLTVHNSLITWPKATSYSKFCRLLQEEGKMRASSTSQEMEVDLEPEIGTYPEGMAIAYGALARSYNSLRENNSTLNQSQLSTIRDVLNTVVSNLISLGLAKSQCITLQGCIALKVCRIFLKLY